MATLMMCSLNHFNSIVFISDYDDGTVTAPATQWDFTVALVTLAILASICAILIYTKAVCKYLLLILTIKYLLRLKQYISNFTFLLT